MKKLLLSLLAGLCLPASSAVLLNEIRIDDDSTDTDEYFELTGNPGESLTGLTLVVIGDGTSTTASGVIERVINLDSFTIGASGYFLAANSALGTDVPFSGTIDLTLASNTFENSDNLTFLLVTGFTGAAADDLDTDDDGTLDSTPWTTVIDAVSFVETTDVPASGEFFYAGALGFSDVGPDGTFVPGHIYRDSGSNEWAIGAFSGTTQDTPGLANVPEPAVVMLGAFGLLALIRRRR